MNTSPFTVLLIEDDLNDALLLQRAFYRAKLTSLLRVLTDAEQAMAYLQRVPDLDGGEGNPMPSLVLLDLNLPGTSGLQMLEWLRKQPGELKNLPVIVLTSSRDTNDIDQAYALGANSYMAKPSGNFDGLAQMVKSFDSSFPQKA
ncbi:MAG: response regulator [Verrucomicrobiota bacterium]